MLKKFSTSGLIVMVVLIAFDGYLLFRVASDRAAARGARRALFLDVGQGDSELFIFGGRRKVLVDAGADKSVMKALAEAFSPDERYIDLAIVTHADLDHFGGFEFLLDGGYSFGAFIYNGREGDPGEARWAAFRENTKRNGIPFISLGAEDRIRFDASDSIEVLSPPYPLASGGASNDAALVVTAETGSLKTILMADAGFGTEALLVEHYGSSLGADILKAGHHGSKYSTSEPLLKALRPRIVILEVGAGNRYGHPSKEALSRIVRTIPFAKVLRTDKSGTIEAAADLAGRIFLKTSREDLE